MLYFYFLSYKKEKKIEKSMVWIWLYKSEAVVCWGCYHLASPGWIRFCTGQFPEPAHLPATELLVPEEGQDIPSHPLTAAAKSGLLQLAPTKENVEMYKLLCSPLKKISEHRLKHW